MSQDAKDPPRKEEKEESQTHPHDTSSTTPTVQEEEEESLPSQETFQDAADGNTLIEGTAIEGTAVVEGPAGESTAVEGPAGENTILEGTAVEGTSVEGTTVHVEGTLGNFPEEKGAPFDASPYIPAGLLSALTQGTSIRNTVHGTTYVTTLKTDHVK